MDFGEAVTEFEEFFSEEMYEDISRAVQKGDDSIVIDFMEMDMINFELSDYLQKNPEDGINAAEEALMGVDIVSNDDMTVRFANMPEEDFVLLKNLRSKHIGKFIPIEGMIKRASQVKPEVVSAIFECEQCGARYEKEQDSSKLKSPYKCEDCGSRKFETEEKVMTDTQVITLEENPENREGSEQPTSLSVRLEGDLVDPEFQQKVVPGNVAHITGVLREKPLKKNSKKYDIYMDANYLEPTQQEFEKLEMTEEEEQEIRDLAKDPEIFEKIAESIAPSIYGHGEIKKAIALQLFGGVKKGREDGVKSRGDIHILLIGEPGTGKSQLLKFTGELSPKGRYVVGKSSTGAGLTASVVKEESTGEFSLEAGAVVLANKGMAAIDEIDKMGEEDRSSLHEAMEQQEISVSKANIQATLNAETAILAAGNPKLGRFDPYEPIPQQINIGDTLLSRFDFIFPVKDEPDEEKDQKLSEQVLMNHIEPEETTGEISQEMLRKYVAYAQKNCRPDLTKDAANKIQEFYVNMRSSGSQEDGDSIPITARQLEALVRVAEASARAELSDEVKTEDAQRAIDILTYSLKQVGVDPETGDYDIDMIESGVSGSQRNRRQTLKQIIKAKSDGGPADRQEVIEEAVEKDIPEDKVEEMIEKMMNEGEVFEPQRGKIQKL
ncbi:minichromosome maintenance protein MCM [Candidatus Nanohalococcus occultus]|uniref:ATPase involved in replication control,Cdc46/Mcm family n=1 Tax=Candidatus Nanohalococcus occultus TaxID=2978047 RepID=A0ABY8CEU1_9ARCH|nr:Putative ATPase involved in replication control,Cdc46/Mcm family [Candidatus Nanohaloarchaeota archaeon SVXNc]